MLEEESRIGAKLQGDNHNLQGKLDQLRHQLEEEQGGRAKPQRLVQKANADAAQWKQKCEHGEGGVRSEEMKWKLTAKLQDAEAQLEAATTKLSSLEKNNHHVNAELEDATI